MKAKFTWNGQVIEQDLRAMSDVPEKFVLVYVLRRQKGYDHAPYARRCGYNGQNWQDENSDTLEHCDVFTALGWCEMPELVEVVE